MNNYVFPFGQVEQGADIILYGAGNVGICFYKQILTSRYANIVCWVDQRWEQLKALNYPVDSPKNMIGKTYDYLIIAVENVSVANEIKLQLVDEYGVDKSKIIHFENCRFADHGLYENVFEEHKAMKSNEILFQVDPKILLSHKRLDLSVRYLVAKDIKNNIVNKNNLSLYSRMILCRSNAYEGPYYFSENTREGTTQFLDSFRELVPSMEAHGFNQDYFIPVGENNILLNGAHRTAAAIALEKKIWIKNFETLKGNENFDEEWFDNNGFSVEDKIRILRAYADLNEKCGIMLFFGPCMEHWEYLQAQVQKQMIVVGKVNFDFSDNYIAFENLFREVYSDPLWRNVYIDRKVDLLKLSPLKIRLLLVSNKEGCPCDLYHMMSQAKQELRDRMYFDTDIAPIVMHSSDSKEEFIHLKQIFLSVNNLKYLRMRIARNYREVFIKRLERLKHILNDKNIAIEDIAISGSSGLEVFGLRNSVDTDFFVKSKYREQFGDCTAQWEKDIEYVRKDSIEISDEEVYSDELLISDDNYHYIFNGLKFVNLDIISAKKRYSAREKDIKDARLFELFKDYVMNFDDKSKLKQQIENEFYKKR